MTKQTGWKHHEWDVVAQWNTGDIYEVDICALCGEWRLHRRDGKTKIVKTRPVLPEGESWL